MRVAVVTALAARGLDEDEPLLLAALERAGAQTAVAAWDDDAVDWSSFDVAAVRSTWDYAARPAEFLRWAGRAAERTTLLNPAPVLTWNLDKTYLRELAGRGVAVVPTTWVAPGEHLELPAGEVVVKPTVSAGSRDTARYAPDEHGAAREHLARLGREGRAAMVQPYVPAVDREGETALLFVGGAYSHAVRKGPLLRPGQGPTEHLFAAESITAVTPTRGQRAAAAAVLEAAPFEARTLAYARVDLVAGEGGEPLLLELELAEPSLFLQHAPEAADRLAAALTAAHRPG